MNFGQIELANFKECKLEQKAASAYCAAMNGIVGADYTPLLFVGTQIVKGRNFYFIAEQKLTTRAGERHVVKLIINEFQNVYKLVSVETII